MKTKLLTSLLMAVCSLTAMAGVTERLDSLFAARYGSDPNAPGGAVLIAKGDSVVYERYFGTADMTTGTRISEDTRFNIASISKQFTVVALLQQDINLDRPVSDFFDFPQKFWRKVTLRHLASQCSGVPDSRDRSDRDKCVFATDESSAAYFPSIKEEDLKFEPGEAYDYLNPSFILLAKVVEQLNDQEFTKYQKGHIFRPAGMSSTYYFDPETSDPLAAHGYVPDSNGGWREYDYGEETFFATRPDGGIYSTARDLLRWESALASGTILPLDRLRMAYLPHIEVTGSEWCDYQNRPNTWYGLGWFVDTTDDHAIKVYHTGDNGGFQAYLGKTPQTGLRVIVLENRNDQDRWAMVQDIDKIVQN